jgi:2-polyprenyl-3-methyl-5-hydroxy-6-metoxy-1,4-benzoquinol methylase
MPFRYDLTIDPEAENNTHAFALAMIGHNKRVLEVGCATGYFTKVLIERGCKVVGMELDVEAAHLAEELAERVVIGDVEDCAVWEQVDDESFDVVTFGDVLEHLRDPLTVLRTAKHKLKPSGFIVSSLPNFAHGDVRLSLLHGDFQYRELGLLDRTHLRFFTLQSIRELFDHAGLIVVDTKRIVVPLFDTELELKREDFPEAVIDEIRADREFETYQFVIKSVIDNGTLAVTELAERVNEQNDAIQAIVVRNRTLEDQLLELSELKDERSLLCSQIDELTEQLGLLRHQADANENDIALRDERITVLTQAVDALRTALADSEKAYSEVRNSTSFRITAPLRRLRRRH